MADIPDSVDVLMITNLRNTLKNQREKIIISSELVQASLFLQMNADETMYRISISSEHLERLTRLS